MPPADFQVPPASLCVLRLSAIGDVCHALPVVRTIQDAWPGTSITWILGRVEHKLIGHLPDVEFVVFDKRAGIKGYRDLRRRLAGRRYDVLLHMQLALRASAASAMVPARIRLGYDRARAREGQWLFTNRRIEARVNQHVLDAMFGFADALGLATRSMRWNIPLGDEAQAQGRRAIPDDAPTLVVSPCSSHELRNWSPERYAALADHAVVRHRLRVIVCGGPTDLERATASGSPPRCTTPARTWSAATRCRGCSPRSAAPRCWCRRTPGPPTWRPRSARRWWASMPPPIRSAAGLITAVPGA